MRRPVAFWLTPLAFVAFAAFELLLFDRAVSRNYAWLFPRWNDQVQYLTEAYTYYEQARQHGLWSGLWQAATKPSAQGVLHAPAAVLLFYFVGPSRSAALFLNALCFVFFQAAFFLALNRRFSAPIAWIGIALSLTWLGIQRGIPGSAVDFRLDFMGACAFGVALCALLASNGLRSFSGSVLFGVSVGATLLTRFLTGTYFLVLLVGLVIWIMRGDRRPRRLRNLGLAVTAAALCAGPVFWINRSWIYDYYYIGHYFGPESAIRNSSMGLGASLRFLAREVVGSHLPALAFCAAALLAAVAFGLRRATASSEGAPKEAEPWFVPCLLFVLAPVLVLTLHQQKSFVVLGVFVPPLLAMLAGGVGVAAHGRARGAFARPFFPFIAACAVGSGLALFSHRIRTPDYPDVFRADARRVNVIADTLYSLSRNQNLDTPRIAVDRVTDTFDGQIMQVICYERKKVWVPFVMTLPTGIAKPEEPLVLERLEQSDFIFVAPDGDLGAGYPFDVAMRDRRAETRTWCASHRKLLEVFEQGGQLWELYGRP